MDQVRLAWAPEFGFTHSCQPVEGRSSDEVRKILVSTHASWFGEELVCCAES